MGHGGEDATSPCNRSRLGLMIDDCQLLIFDVSLNLCFLAKQAHIGNQKSTILNRQSEAREHHGHLTH